MKERTIFVGDIHGCLKEFEELLEKINYNSQTDRLILLGDFVDRGPDSIGVLRKIRKMNVECVRGNHDHKILKWINNNKNNFKNNNQQFYDELTDDDIEFIFKMPLYIKLDDVVAVHAGIKPFIPMDRQRPDDLMYLRYTDENRKFISLRQIHKAEGEDIGAKFWTEFGPFGTNVVYGHNVFSEVKIDEFSDGTACYGIDTGCCFGGFLTALIWETKEIIQVKAHQEYVKLGF